MQFVCLILLGYKASMVSYKCSRVPPFLNSLELPRDVRQYLVDFVFNSDAAFKIFEVRLDPLFMMYAI